MSHRILWLVSLLSLAVGSSSGCTVPHIGSAADGGSDALVIDADDSADAFAVDAFAEDAFEPDAFEGIDAWGPPPPPTSFAFTGVIDTYVVPGGVTQVHIVADGASGGGSGTYAGGHGAHVEATITVAPGDVLSVLVGEQPETIPLFADGCGGSGGGGTYVVRDTAPLVIAGAGAGASSFSSYSRNGGDASLTPDGGSSATYLGGMGGLGGGAPTGEGGGGGGLSSDGAMGEGAGGLAFTHGGAGGARATTESCAGANGGFGGGGGGGNDVGAGGGGYSGGAAGSDVAPDQPSGGGGSFVATDATETMILLRADEGSGSVVITPQ